MKLIATHNSATGEAPTWWSALLTPFAKTQSKDIVQQLMAGCTLFDIRVKKVFGVWRCAHGWWFTKKTFESIMMDLNLWAEMYPGQPICVSLTYEGKSKNAGEFLEYVKDIKRKFSHLCYGATCSKYGKDSKGLIVKYDVLLPEDKNFPNIRTEQYFLPLDGRNWQTYLPIPWLWKQFYFKNVSFNDEYYKFVDFL